MILPDYKEMWTTAKLNDDPQMRDSLDFLFLSTTHHLHRHKKVEALTGIPWKFVASVNMRECAGRYDLGLHCGQRFDRPTTLEPKGCGPFKSWEDAAVDALKRKNLHLVSNWDIFKILEMAERYNGLGYVKFHPEVNSPYLWSGTNHYTVGKYSSDGNFNPHLKDRQPGIAAFLMRLKAGGL